MQSVTKHRMPGQVISLRLLYALPCWHLYPLSPQIVSTIFSCGWLCFLKSLFSKLFLQGHRTGSFSSLSSFIYKRGRKSLISQWERQKFKSAYYTVIFYDKKYLNSFLCCGFHNVPFIHKPVLYLSTTAVHTSAKGEPKHTVIYKIRSAGLVPQDF